MSWKEATGSGSAGRNLILDLPDRWSRELTFIAPGGTVWIGSPGTNISLSRAEAQKISWLQGEAKPVSLLYLKANGCGV
jgi:hypothetical protein